MNKKLIKHEHDCYLWTNHSKKYPYNKIKKHSKCPVTLKYAVLY